MLFSFNRNNRFYSEKSGWGNSRADNSISTENQIWHHWFSWTADTVCNFGIGLNLLTEMDHKLPLTALIFAVLMDKELHLQLVSMGQQLLHSFGLSRGRVLKLCSVNELIR